MIFTTCFYAVCVLALIVIYLHGGTVSQEERHFRSAGTLIFVCVLAVAAALPRKAMGRLAVFTFCGLMSINGAVLMVKDARSARQEPVDPYSGIRQDDMDMRALEFANSAFAREGRNDVFVLENSGVASAFPPNARILVTEFLFEPESMIAARRYAGGVPGHLYVLMQTTTAQAVKGTLLLKLFPDYPFNVWESHQFGKTSVFVQAATPALCRENELTPVRSSVMDSRGGDGVPVACPK